MRAVLFLRGLRWRRGFAVAVFVVGTVCAAVAALGPLYARGATESAVTDEIRASGSEAGLAFTRSSGRTDPAFFDTFESQARAGTHVPGFDRPILGESLVVNAIAADDYTSTSSTMVYRSDVCAHLRLTSGRCPITAGEAVVPRVTSIGGPRWAAGTELTLHLALGAPGAQDGQTVGHVRVVGSYLPRDVEETYWFGLPYFQAGLGPSVRSLIKTAADPLFVARGQFAAVPRLEERYDLPGKHYDVDVPIQVGRVRLAGLRDLAQTAATVQQRFPRRPAGGRSPAMHTQLPAVLARVERDRRAVETATLVVVVEMAALSLLVLFQLVTIAVDARRNEIALAKLRGLRPTATARFALAEPLTLLALAAPAGLALAWLAAHLLARWVLLPGTPVALVPATGWALGAVSAGAALAAGGAAARTLTRSVLDQWRGAEHAARLSRWALVLDVVVAAAAVVSVVALLPTIDDRDHAPPSQYLLLAPALVVFAVASLGIRGTPRLLRGWVERTRASRHIAVFVALRQTVRRPGGLRLGLLLGVAAGLMTFAVCGQAVALGNREARAQTEVGAARDLSVLDEPGHDPQTIVHRVDPHGRWAMAAAAWSPEGGPPGEQRTVTGEVLGVEPARLPHVAYRVRGQRSPAALARDIVTAGTPRPAGFHGNTVSLEIDAIALRGDRPAIRVGYRHEHEPPASADSTPLSAGVHTYTVHVPCGNGCTFTGLTVERGIDAVDDTSGSLVLRSLRLGEAHLPSSPRAPASWHPGKVGDDASASLRAERDGLRVDFRSSGGSSPVLAYADTPSAVPIVTAPDAPTTGSANGAVVDSSFTAMTFRIARREPILPVVLTTGSVADLNYLRTRLRTFDVEAAWHVWLGSDAPADAATRLSRAGLLIQHRSSATGRVALLARQGPALGLLLLLVCAVVGALLAAGGTAVALLSQSKRRGTEFAALRMLGVRRSVVRRSAVYEQLLLLGSATVAGLVGGYLAAVVMLPVVPEFADPTAVVLRYRPPILLALAAVGCFAALLLALAAGAGALLVRAARPARLREIDT